MKGLIVKDLLMIKGNGKAILTFLFVFCIISLQGNDIIYFVPAFISMMIFMTTFSYDEYNKWDAYAITLPIKKDSIVLSKYIGSISLLLFSLIVTFLIALIIGIINQNFDAEYTLTLLGACGGSIVFLEAIIFPLLIKFGVEKGRIGVFIGVFVIAALLGFIFTGIDLENANGFIEFFNNYYYILIPLVAVILMVISYFISKRIYLKKEF